MRIIALDPGNEQTALCELVDGKPRQAFKIPNAELLGKTALERGQGKVCRNQASLALADDLEQVHVAERLGITHRLVARLAQFHRHGIEGFRSQHFAHGLDAGTRDMRGSKQHELHAVSGDARDLLCGQQLAAACRRRRCVFVDLHGIRIQSRYRLSRSA